tara:strand:- start:740 stop:880 length:141 start_codon:yes stop_codon:yes gene_type:complete
MGHGLELVPWVFSSVAWARTPRTVDGVMYMDFQTWIVENNSKKVTQ